MHTIEYPGHGTRMDEPLLTELETIVQDSFQLAKGHLKKPYALYGHSMGAMVAFLMLRLISKNNMPMPECVFVSGKSAPSAVKEEKTYRLAKSHFWKKITEYGGCSPEVLQDNSLIELFEPILRADIEALEEYRYVKQGEPHDVPFIVLNALCDSNVTREEAMLWQEVTTLPLTLCEFEGDHFFLFEHRERITGLIKKVLSRKGTGVNAPHA